MFSMIIPIIFPLTFNFWLGKIYMFDSTLCILVIVTSMVFWVALNSNKLKYLLLSVVLMAILLTVQWYTSAKTSLTYLTEQEKVTQIQHLHAYPPLKITIMRKIIWIPAANWLELRPEAVIFYKIKANFSEIVDPNLYFFANHPRERVGVVEFEKFPYIFLPAFLIGLFSFKHRHLLLLSISLSPILLNSLIGNSHPAGPFNLFPFFAITIALGLVVITPYILKRKVLILPTLLLFFLIFIQTLAYVRY